MTPQIKRHFDGIFRRFSLIFGSAEVIGSNKSGLKLKFDEDEVREGVPVVQPYGFHSIPKPGTRCVVASTADRNKSFVIGARLESLHNQASGEVGVVQMLNDEGASVTLQNGKVTIKCDNFVVRNAKKDLVELNTELLEIIQQLVKPGGLISSEPGKPVVVDPTIAAKIEMLKVNWG